MHCYNFINLLNYKKNNIDNKDVKQKHIIKKRSATDIFNNLRIQAMELYRYKNVQI